MKLFTLLIFIISYSTVVAQNSYKIIIVDNIGRTDTVVFAKDYTATSSIDTAYGEINLYNTPIDSLEIRSIQRDSANHLCITNTSYGNLGSPLYYDGNLDLKRDFRSYGHTRKDNNFEFTIKAVEYPITIIADFTNWYPSGTWYKWICFLDSNCNITGVNEPDQYNLDTLMIDSFASITGLIVKFEHEVGIDENIPNFSFNISPNPTSSIFKINFNNLASKNSELIITSMDGQVILKEKIKGKNNLDIDLSGYNSGMYLIQLKNNKGNYITKKIIKK